MLDIAIIGGGLCGLATANRLKAEARSFQLFEARHELGGRIRTAFDPVNQIAVDLGAAWFWPDSQPLVADLVASLGLTAFPQHDEGNVLVLSDLDNGPQVYSTDPVHEGAHRVAEGLGQVIAGLAAALPDDCIQTGHTLTDVEDRDDHVRLTFRIADGTTVIEARRVVLAVPPRLVAERVRFSPALPQAVLNALNGTETWMAAEAKAAAIYPAAAWRRNGLSGNAFVNHDMAMLAEVFDLSNPSGRPAALGGFVALPPENRAGFEGGLPMLIGSQMVQLFGETAGDGETLYQDWASEPLTCSALDRTLPSNGRRTAGTPLLRRPLWNSRLHFAGSETASEHAGQMEGALRAAQRVTYMALRPAAETAQTLSSAESLSDFTQWMGAQDGPAFETYRRSLTRLLSTHRSSGATREAARESISILFEDALGVLAGIQPVSASSQPDAAAIIGPIKHVSGTILSGLIGDIVEFNRTSCALSNFPQEHQLTDDYLKLMLRDASALGKTFLQDAYALLVTNAEAA